MGQASGGPNEEEEEAGSQKKAGDRTRNGGAEYPTLGWASQRFSTEVDTKDIETGIYQPYSQPSLHTSETTVLGRAIRPTVL